MNTIEMNTEYKINTRNFVSSANIELTFKIVKVEKDMFTRFICKVQTSDNRKLDMTVSCFAPEGLKSVTIYQMFDLVTTAYDNKEFTPTTATHKEVLAEELTTLNNMLEACEVKGCKLIKCSKCKGTGEWQTGRKCWDCSKGLKANKWLQAKKDINNRINWINNKDMQAIYPPEDMKAYLVDPMAKLNKMF